MKKYLIISDTFISGDPVFKGQVIEADNANASNLLLANRAVEISKATPEQLKFVEERKALEAKKGAK